MSRLLLLVALSGAALCGVPPARAAIQLDSTEYARAVETYVRNQMEIAHIPSVSVAVVRDGSTELLQSYGTASLEWDAPATPRTAYPLASATKPFTGIVLMALVEDGLIALDSSITTYLPSAPATWEKITLRHLATHMSGISDDYGPGAPRDAEEATRRLSELPLMFAPGSRSSYGIGGYVVLQHVIEQKTGQSFAEVLRKRVLDPLGLTDTRFDDATNDGPFREADVVPRRTGVYAWDGENQRLFWFHYGAEAYTAGGLLSTSADLARLIAALDTGRLLSTESHDQMWGNAESPDAFGLGWTRGTYRGRRTVGHSGGPALADILRFPDERLTIIVLTNQSRMYPYLAQGIADLLLPALPEADPPELPDDSPEITARVIDLLHALARGNVVDEAFSIEARTGFIPQVRMFLIPYTRSLGRPGEVQLIGDERGDEWRRVYRVSYGEKLVDWTVQLSRDGLIGGMGPTPR